MSDYKNISRNDLNVLASKLEGLAKELQSRLVAAEPNDLLKVSNEIVRNTNVLTFQLGELFHAENTKSVATASTNTKSVTVTPVNTTKKVNLNYHNKRDARGRFSV